MSQLHRSAIPLLAWAVLTFACTGQVQNGVESADSPLASDFSDSDLIEKSLMIRDPLVVDSVQAQSRLDNAAASGEGVWSFAHLIESISGSQDPRDVASGFLSQLVTSQQVNGFVVEPNLNFLTFPSTNPVQDALDRWCRTPDGKLDLSKAPFRLLAIVNRFDLRQDATQAGELRFIFNLLTTDDSCRGVDDSTSVFPAVTGTAGFNVIFELSQPTYSQPIWGWLVSYYWRMISQMPFGQTYEIYLSWLTERTVNAHDPSRLNGSQLNQVRTNQGISFSEWSLREFRLDGSTGSLRMVSPAAGPDFQTFNNSPEIAAFIQQNSLAISAGTLSAQPVPEAFMSRAFGGGESRTTQQWSVNGIGNPAFTFQTCGGCHNHGATGPHVGGTFPTGREAGQPAQLSTFMDGRFTGGAGELGRRARLLKAAPETFSVTSVDAFVSASSFSPGRGSPGDPLLVNSVSDLPGAGSDTNWLGLFALDAPDTSPIQTVNLASTTALTTSGLTAPTQPGTYEVRLFTAQGRTATSGPLSIELNSRYVLFHSTFVHPGGTVFGGWQAPLEHDANDHIGLFRAGDADSSPVWSQATGLGNASFDGSFAMGFLNVPAPQEPGAYELRYFRGISNLKTAQGELITVR